MLMTVRLWRIARDQRETILQQRRMMAEMRLEYARSTRDLIEQFWITQEAGIDVRDELRDGLRDLQDEVARLEEHSV